MRLVSVFQCSNVPITIHVPMSRALLDKHARMEFVKLSIFVLVLHVLLDRLVIKALAQPICV